MALAMALAPATATAMAMAAMDLRVFFLSFPRGRLPKSKVHWKAGVRSPGGRGGAKRVSCCSLELRVALSTAEELRLHDERSTDKQVIQNSTSKCTISGYHH